MKAVDTNILARLVLQDDAEQLRTAEAELAGPVWVSNTVWIELGWVLQRRLRLDRAVVGNALLKLLSIETVNTTDRDGLTWAIERYRRGADWADMVHLVAARGVADSFVTFDRALAGAAGDAPVAIRTLA